MPALGIVIVGDGSTPISVLVRGSPRDIVLGDYPGVFIVIVRREGFSSVKVDETENA